MLRKGSENRAHLEMHGHAYDKRRLHKRLRWKQYNALFEIVIGFLLGYLTTLFQPQMLRSIKQDGTVVINVK
jgi:hypothetical protein